MMKFIANIKDMLDVENYLMMLGTVYGHCHKQLYYCMMSVFPKNIFFFNRNRLTENKLLVTKRESGEEQIRSLILTNACYYI